ncbi:type II toxin-antitoxin system RelE/ParE family toxin [bacterium]|nr:MAG: type II toxin-antitoxin system RelE/ParE family toxin [bacterium]
MAAVKLLPRAQKDLAALPEPLQDEVLEKIELLAKFPEMGPPMERAFQGFRFLLAGRGLYRIVYSLKTPKQVEIAYIRHCRRQIGLRLLR